MSFKAIRFYLWAWPMVFACSAFYAVILTSGINQIATLGDYYFKVVLAFSFVLFSLYGLIFLAPKLRTTMANDSLNSHYTSARASRIAVFVGASIGTVVLAPQTEHIPVLQDLPSWVAALILFVTFACAVAVFSHFVWKPGRRIH